MAKVLDMPKLSPTMEEGQLITWHKKEGDQVAVDDLLAEVETDKATMEYRSFDSGTLLKILVPAGSVVQLGQPVGIIGKAGEDIQRLLSDLESDEPAVTKVEAHPPGAAAAEPMPPTPRSPHPVTTKAAPPATVDLMQAAPTPRSGDSATPSPQRGADAVATKEAAREAPQVAQAQPATPAPPRGDGRVKASPYVRKVARERGLNLHAVTGTGPGGRIIARDLDSIPQAAPAAPTVPAQPARGTAGAPPVQAPPPVLGLAAPEARPLSMMRKTIARRLVESKQTVPHFYLSIDVDADPLNALREQINADLSAQPEKEGQAPLKVSFNDLLIKACAIALVRVPECNAQFSPDAILIHRRVDISVAVAVADGLVTPVVRSANTKSVLGIAAEVRDLAARARAKKLRPEEMQNGTFSISNLGMYGIDDFAAVINPPEGAILAVGQVRREPVVKGEAVVPGRRLGMTLSCDHRAIDGAVGATFLKVLRGLLEHPTQVLML